MIEQGPRQHKGRTKVGKYEKKVTRVKVYGIGIGSSLSQISVNLNLKKRISALYIKCDGMPLILK